MGLQFKDWLIRRGSKPATIHNHIETLDVIQRSITIWTKESLDKFIVSLIQKGLKNSTINHYIDTIRVYSQYAQLSDDLQNFKHIKKEFFSKATFSTEEIEEFLKLKPTVITKAYKTDQMFWELLIFTGARPGEIGRLTINEIDFNRNVVLITKTKTGIPRQVPIPPNIQDKLGQYVQSLPSKYLFVTSRGNIYSDSCWQHSFSWRVKRLGIKRDNLTPYSFRHSFITSMLSEDVSPFKVAKQCGNSVEVIAQSYEHMVVKDLEEAIKRHPLVRKSLEGKDILNYIETYIKELNLAGNNKLKFNYSRSENGLALTVTVTRNP